MIKEILLDRVGDQKAGVLLLVKEHHGTQVTDPFLAVSRAGYHVYALHLKEERKKKTKKRSTAIVCQVH